MLLPESRLERLIEQLGALPAGDRHAILARLTSVERDRVRAALRRAAKPPVPASPYSPDLAACIAAGANAPITPAAQAALAAALKASGAAPDTGRSLLDAFSGLLGRRSLR